MRSEIYNNFKALMPDEIATFGVYNSNLLYTNKDTAFATPAVFIEFEPFIWQQGSQGVKDSPINIKLHVITINYNTAMSGEIGEDEALEIFDIADKVALAVTGTSGTNYSTIVHTTSITDHNFNAISDNVEVFSCNLRDSRKYAEKYFTDTPLMPVVNTV